MFQRSGPIDPCELIEMIWSTATEIDSLFFRSMGEGERGWRESEEGRQSPRAGEMCLGLGTKSSKAHPGKRKPG